MKGWLYVLENKSLPNIFMVGFSNRDPINLAEEMAFTGTPMPYSLQFEIFVDDCNSLYKLFINEISDRKITPEDDEKNDCSWFEYSKGFSLSFGVIDRIYRIVKTIGDGQYYYANTSRSSTKKKDYDNAVKNVVWYLDDYVDFMMENINNTIPNHELLKVALAEHKKNKELMFDRIGYACSEERLVKYRKEKPDFEL